MTSPERVDAGAVEPTGDGVQWTLKASTDLNANLVWLAPGGGFAARLELVK